MVYKTRYRTYTLYQYLPIEAGWVRDKSGNPFNAQHKKIVADSPTPQKGAPPESNDRLKGES
jgi:hypothetical protein